ncbi:MAG: pyruvate, phosphate dikinase [Bacteriovoracaceae bacterium]
MTKWVYSFSITENDGRRDMKNLLGGKGANLCEMCLLGLQVPPGFTITTEACIDFYNNNQQIKEEIKEQAIIALKKVEKQTGKEFGSETNPLLFSVRSGARVSMPGMMDTVLNLGLNEKTVESLAKLTGKEAFAWDSYRRFIQMYSNVVLGVNVSLFESTLEDMKEARGVHNDTDLTAKDLKELVAAYKKILLMDYGIKFPSDPYEQLWKAVFAVFNSWNNARAVQYRNFHGYAHNWGTAVTVQSMVFGNFGDDSGTGVAFTRNPSTGENYYFGEFLINAQGEDVVAGIRTPSPLNNDSKNDSNKNFKTLEEVMPNVYKELSGIFAKLEHHYKDMQDIEFTIEKGKLYILQTRNGKRTARAALKIAVDLVNSGLITKEEALLKLQPEDLNQLLHPILDPKFPKKVLTKGLPASPGAASGAIVFDSHTAYEQNALEKKVILVRLETSPEDISGMIAAQGILTTRGGMTSHAAVVAHGMGKSCVAGCSAVFIDYENKLVTIAGKQFKQGDFITIDGGTGEVIDGIVPTIDADFSGDFETFMKWADSVRTLKVRTNADNPEDSLVARKFGAEGIGLCRTEHMFFAPERILAVREMIFAQSKTERKKALDKILPFQKQDFIGIFKVMANLPVNIRLLDPPLHEFLPHTKEEKEELANYLHIPLKQVIQRGEALHEFNPMLGHRGCRLGISFPEIYIMQVRAIIEAAIEVTKAGTKVTPEIMIPLIAQDTELKIIREYAETEIKEIFKEKNFEVPYKLGTMIELPRAAITAASIAKHADFFSFGTNDLTQTTFGISRDDGGKFLPHYSEQGIFQVDPFVSLDQEGVGYLVQFAATEGRKVNNKLHVGICGEHGGESKSIEFCYRIGLDYVSCSPYRVPVAKLAAAQAVLNNRKKS